jgi:hypothetical protein
MICILFIQVKLNELEKLSSTRNTNSCTSLTEKQIVSLVSLELSK